MRDPGRITEALAELEAHWRKYPDLRLAQIVYNAASVAEPGLPSCSELYNMEDEVLLEGLRQIP